MSVSIHSDEGQHLWMETKIGTKKINVEGYYCVRCQEQRQHPWTGRGPDLTGCPKGSMFVDKSILHRQPRSVREQTAKFDIEALKLTSKEYEFPIFAICILSGADFVPVLFNPRNRGVILVRDNIDAERTVQILGREGLQLETDQEIALKPIHSQEELLNLPKWCDIFEHPIKGTYIDLESTPQGIGFNFIPFTVDS
jgi:hypothetical protein